MTRSAANILLIVLAIIAALVSSEEIGRAKGYKIGDVEDSLADTARELFSKTDVAVNDRERDLFFGFLDILSCIFEGGGDCWTPSPTTTTTTATTTTTTITTTTITTTATPTPTTTPAPRAPGSRFLLRGASQESSQGGGFLGSLESIILSGASDFLDRHPKQTIKKVTCGSHKADTCEECPHGKGKAWCNGDCAWDQDQMLCKPLPKFVHPAYDSLVELYPFQPVRDEKRQLVNIILVRSAFLDDEHQKLYEMYKNDILFLGIMSYEAFPFPSPNPWSMKFPHNKYLDMFPGWLNMYRNPQDIFSENVKVIQMSQSDFSLPDIDYEKEVSQGKHVKKYDFVYSMSPGTDDLSKGCNTWGAFAKNWTFVTEALEVMCGELGMTGVLLGTKDQSGAACEIPKSCQGKMKQTKFQPQDVAFKYMRQSKFLFLPQVYDASPRIATQAMALNLPLLMNRNIVGGWKYVNDETGEFFHDMSDFKDSLQKLVENLDTYQPRKHILDEYGTEKSGMKLRAFVEENFGDRVELPEGKLLIPSGA